MLGLSSSNGFVVGRGWGTHAKLSWMRLHWKRFCKMFCLHFLGKFRGEGKNGDVLIGQFSRLSLCGFGGGRWLFGWNERVSMSFFSFHIYCVLQEIVFMVGGGDISESNDAEIQ